MTDTTQPNRDRDRPSDREAALDRNYPTHGWDNPGAAHKKSGKTPEGGR